GTGEHGVDRPYPQRDRRARRVKGRPGGAVRTATPGPYPGPHIILLVIVPFKACGWAVHRVQLRAVRARPVRAPSSRARRTDRGTVRCVEPATGSRLRPDPGSHQSAGTRAAMAAPLPFGLRHVRRTATA